MAPECLKLAHLKLARKNAMIHFLFLEARLRTSSFTYMLTIKQAFDQWNYCKKVMQSSNSIISL